MGVDVHQLDVNEGSQDMPPHQKMSLWPMDDFEPKAIKNQ